MNTDISPRSQQVIEARAVAKNATEFARMLNICNKTVWKYYARYNIEPFPHGGHQKHPRADEVCELFKAGKAMSAIAAELGLTRGSVAGILGRAGMFKQRAPRQKKATRPKITQWARVTVRPKVRAQPFRERIPPAPFLGVPLLERKFNQCAYPDPTNFDPRNALYCGQPTSGTLPYCEACMAVMYRPAEARERAPRPRA